MTGFPFQYSIPNPELPMSDHVPRLTRLSTPEEMMEIVHGNLHSIPSPLAAFSFSGTLEEYGLGPGQLDDVELSEAHEDALRSSLLSNREAVMFEYPGCQTWAYWAADALEALQARAKSVSAGDGGAALLPADREQLRQFAERVEHLAMQIQEVDWPELLSQSDISDDDLTEVAESLSAFEERCEELGSVFSGLCDELEGLELPRVLRASNDGSYDR